MSVNFYHAYYKRQQYHEDTGQWEDTFYDHQGIIVIADSISSARIKIDECLKKVESGKYRAVLNGDIVECSGLDRRHEFDWSFEVNPIMKG